MNNVCFSRHVAVFSGKSNGTLFRIINASPFLFYCSNNVA
jgi:hypothetical protein